MSVTVTDLFCGAGGSSIGATAAGATLLMAANHWQTAIDVHQQNFPDAAHDCADVSQADPRRYPRTNVLLASPECTNHSQARGISRKRQDSTLWDAPDPSAERSRATMWDVVRFAEQMHYEVMVVENVVEATKWVLWPAWRQALLDLGYETRVLSHNSMHHGVPQSRDRIYVACWLKGLQPDLELEVVADCSRCAAPRAARQTFKEGRSVGRYRRQWVWQCCACHSIVEPACEPAASIIDWSLVCPKIGDRRRPLAENTRARILAGMQKYGWAPIVTVGAGNGFETTPGNRARPLSDPLWTQSTTASAALASPPGFLVQTAHGGRLHDVEDPAPTVCASDDRLSLVIPLRRNGRAERTSSPLPAVTAGGTHHGLLVRSYGFEGAGANGRFTSPTDAPTPTLVSTQRPGLLMRNNGGGAEMITPLDEPARTLTSKGHQSLLTGPASYVDECGFRMLEPAEIAAAMSFPADFIPDTLSKKDRVKLAGNAVTPPVMTWILGRLIRAMESAA